MPQAAKKVKFATQADPEVLGALRQMANQEGRQLQALVDEALRDYVERKHSHTPRQQVVEALQASITQYDELYKKLAQ